MQFGLNFFPCVSPEQKTAERYFREAMHLCSLTDELGYSDEQVRRTLLRLDAPT